MPLCFLILSLFSVPISSCVLVGLSFSAQLWTPLLFLFLDRCVPLLLTSLPVGDYCLLPCPVSLPSTITEGVTGHVAVPVKTTCPRTPCSMVGIVGLISGALWGEVCADHSSTFLLLPAPWNGNLVMNHLGLGSILEVAEIRWKAPILDIRPLG